MSTCNPDNDDPFDKLAPFEEIGRYRLHRKLSEGGMGQVWLAHARHSHSELEDKLLPYPVAIKFARLSKVLDQSVKEGMLTEGGIMSKLNWGMIPVIYEIGQCEGLSFVAMEYIEGVPLSEFNESVVRNGIKMPFDSIATIAYDAARTLDYIHNVDWGGERQNLIHCDITDHNFMISGHGRLMLIDFGIAKGPVETSHQGVKGTPRAMAPEQFRGEVSPAVDAYGLGTVLWSLIEGAPFRSFPHEVLMPMVATGQYPPLQRPGIPPALRAICEGLLEPDPTQRMHLSEVISSLEQYFTRSWSELKKLVSTSVGRRAQRTGMTNDMPVLTDDLRKTRAAARLLSPATQASLVETAQVLRPPAPSALELAGAGPHGTSEVAGTQGWLLQQKRSPASPCPPDMHGTISEGATTSWARPVAGARTEQVPPDIAQSRVVVRTEPTPAPDERAPKVYGRTEQLPVDGKGEVTTPRGLPEPAQTETLDMSRLHPPRAPQPATVRGKTRWAAGFLTAACAAGLSAYAFSSLLDRNMLDATEEPSTPPATVHLPTNPPPASQAAIVSKQPQEASGREGVEPRKAEPEPEPPQDAGPKPSVILGRTLEDPIQTPDAGSDRLSQKGETLPELHDAQTEQQQQAQRPVEKARPPKVASKIPPVMVQLDVMRDLELPPSTEITIGGRKVDLERASHIRLMLPAGKKRVRWRSSPGTHYTRAPQLILEPGYSYVVSLSQAGPRYDKFDSAEKQRGSHGRQ